MTREKQVATNWIMIAIHKGEFSGIPPSGRIVTLRGMDFYDIESNMVIFHCNVLDMPGLITQIKH
jgi:predicted ester cyclase